MKKQLLKILAGLAIVAYALHAKVVDFGALRDILFSPLVLAVGLGFQLLLNGIAALRWYTLCRAQSLSFTLGRLFTINWLSSFLGLVLPGPIGADLVKGWYMAGESPEARAITVLTVFFDRVIGCAGLFFLSAAALFVFRSQVWARPQFVWVAWGVWAVAGALLLGAVLFYFATARFAGNVTTAQSLASAGIMRRLPRFLSGAILKFTSALMLYRRHWWQVVAAQVISIGYLALNAMLYAFLGDRLGVGLPVAQYLYVIPLSVLVTYFSFLPLGLGIGQLFFYQIFAWAGLRPEAGATLCTLAQMQAMIYALAGVLAFFRFRRQQRHPHADAASERQSTAVSPRQPVVRRAGSNRG